MFDFFATAELPAPAVPVDELEGLLAAGFGLAVVLEPLGSQQDQNLLARDPATGRVIGVVKLTNPAFDDAEIELQDLAAAAVAASCPQLRVARVVEVDGRLLSARITTSSGPLNVRLIHHLAGGTLTGSRHLAPSVIERLGTLAASVSRALEGVAHPAESRRLQWDLQHARQVVDLLVAAEPDPALRERVLLATREAADVVDGVADRLPRQLGHFDLTDDNVIRGGDGLPDGIIDFGDVTRSWAVGELAVTLSSVLHHAGARPTSILPGVRAFDAVRPLGGAEVEALWPLIVLRTAVLVVSGRDQVRIDPGNAYARAGADREQLMFEQATALPIPVMTALIREALGRPAPAPVDSPVAVALDAPLDAVVLESGVTSALNDDGAWLDPSSTGAEALRRLDAGAAAVVLPFSAVVLAGSPPLAAQEPATVTTGLTAWFALATAFGAPFPGTVTASADGVELVGDHLTLRVAGATDAVATAAGTHVEKGASLAELPAQTPIGIQLVRGALAVPPLVRASESGGWLAAVIDPAPLVGIAPVGSATADDLLERRSGVLAEVQEHYYDRPPRIERGWREHLIDVDGRVYLDMVNNVASVGHAHPRIAAAAARQLRLLNTNSRFHYAAVTEFAERLSATLPEGLDTVFLVNSGSEATDLAIRIAMAATGRRDIVAMREAYHGWTLASDAVSTSIADNPDAVGTRPNWAHTVDAANAYRGRHRGADAARYAPEAVGAIERLAARTPLAGFIAEPFFGNAGGIPLPDGYLGAVYAAIRDAGGLAIADEVQVGYGRLGRWFWGFQQQGVVPDVVAVAKSIGAGYPLGAVVTSRAIADAYSGQGYFFSSTGGSPLSSVIGSTVLAIIADEGLQANARDVGDRLKGALQDLATRHELIGAVHGAGLYLGVEFVRDRRTLEPATAETAAICDRLLDLGVIMQPTGDHQNVLKIKPPLCITAQSADFFVDALDRVLTEGW